MPTYQDNDTADFKADVDRLYKLIENVLYKGQYTNAEKYIKYLFIVIIIYYQKQSKISIGDNLGSFSTPVDLSTSSVKEEENNIFFLNYHNIDSNSTIDKFAENLKSLISKQIKPGNFKVFYFIIGLLTDAVAFLLNDNKTIRGGAMLMRIFKFVNDQILFFEKDIPRYERGWYSYQTFDWFLNLYSISIKNPETLYSIEIEIREVLRQFVDEDRVDLFQEFLNSVSSRFFAFTTSDDVITKKYEPKIGSNEYSDFKSFISANLNKFNRLNSIKSFRNDFKKYQNDVDNKKNWGIDLSGFKNEFGQTLFNKFKLVYIKIILIDAIAYSIFKGKNEFFIAYLNYHSPFDADASWINKDYSIQKFNQIIPILESYERLMPESYMWADRHSVTTYLNTFLGYFILKEKSNEIENYINSITEKEIIETVLYNFNSISEKNVLRTFLEKLPDNLKDSPVAFENKLQEILDLAKSKLNLLDLRETREFPIDLEIKSNFFSNFFKDFESQSVLRSIYKYHRKIEERERAMA